MVVERVALVIIEGREHAFEQAFVSAGALLRSATGCLSVRLARGVEKPSSYLLLIEWASIDAHRAFTKTPEFVRFGEMAGPYFAGKPSMEHFEPIDTDGSGRE